MSVCIYVYICILLSLTHSLTRSPTLSQAAAERERRKKVLEAEGDKRSAELQSEGRLLPAPWVYDAPVCACACVGMKIRLQNESEGMLIKVRNEATARKAQYELEAEGEAKAIEMRARAQANAIKIIADMLEAAPSSAEAAKLFVAKQVRDAAGLGCVLRVCECVVVYRHVRGDREQEQHHDLRGEARGHQRPAGPGRSGHE